jgi:predicted aminopeptidase
LRREIRRWQKQCDGEDPNEGAGVQVSREALSELERQLGVHTGYDAWLDEGLNNAHLASIATYFDCVPGFERLLAQQHGELDAYYAVVRALGRGPAAARAALCEQQPAT